MSVPIGSGTVGLESSVIKEYRIALPLTLDEVNIGKLYTVCDYSKEETGGGEGVEVVANEPYESKNEKGQYTHKVIHLKSKVPGFVRMLAPSGSLEIHEKSWNAFPGIRTEYSNPSYMKDNFHIVISTIYKVGYQQEDNVFGLEGDKLSKRQIDFVDMVNDKIEPSDYKDDEDPTKFKSTKQDRGPFAGADWYKTQTPVLMCYKLYEIQFKWFGLQTKMENVIVKGVRRILMNLARKMTCWLDKYSDMTMADIRKYEEETKGELEKLRRQSEVRGMIEK